MGVLGYPLASGIDIRSILGGILEPKGPPWGANGETKGQKIFKKLLLGGYETGFEEHVWKKKEMEVPSGSENYDSWHSRCG